jgi:4-hydroxy-4-methyl-2-oxoglutarate aldolase
MPAGPPRDRTKEPEMPPALTRTFPASAILLSDVPRPPEGVVEALQALDGLACLVSDVLDEMGIAGVVPASRLRPVLSGRTIVGPAVTLRKMRISEVVELRDGPRRGDIEAHNQTRPGDVLVIEGLEEVSNMGGLSALTSQRQGAVGAVIWGGCRDVADLRRIGYPVWSTTVTPVTGVGRIDGVAINGEVRLGEIAVQPGDIIVADDDGVCVIPHGHTAEVAARVRAKAEADAGREARIRSGMTIHEIATGRPPPRS